MVLVTLLGPVNEKPDNCVALRYILENFLENVQTCQGMTYNLFSI